MIFPLYPQTTQEPLHLAPPTSRETFKYLKRTHFCEPGPAPRHESSLSGTQQVPSFEDAKQLTGDAGLERTHFPGVCADRRFQAKSLYHQHDLIVNAQGDPVQTTSANEPISGGMKAKRTCRASLTEERP